ncbi:hypothetical protein B0T16DRAFT_431678 [Cercophora newfieldiana]|uniref:STAS domain-containing protein n=1 Tax=Cercophora newfieldiana TaxID=92897 RepID=A0AA39XYM7_9PEZI|nr:hypothetical protein B0T16DRAFT_431678 [Cercophora newfieldiana]
MSRPGPFSSVSHDHAPVHPSGLRQSHSAASYASLDDAAADAHPHDSPPVSPRSPPVASNETSMPGFNLAGPSRQPETATETTSLLGYTEHAHDGPCNHGTFSPRPMSPTDSLAADSNIYSGSESDGSLPAMDGGVLSSEARKKRKSWKQLASKMKSKKMSTSSALAKRHGFKDSTLMYLSYYLPVLVWAREYNWSYFKGDFVAALTVAGMYVPMALSLADNLAHVPAINGLYSFVFSPLVYALLGSCPSMIVGPEAAGSLLVGTVIKGNVDAGKGGDSDAVLQATICGVVAGLAGGMVFVAGLARLGFLDGVLSRPFLRGFISAIGVVIAVDQLIPELGLNRLLEDKPAVRHGSSVDKLRFILGNLDKTHHLTFAVAASSFIVIMVCREIKRRMQSRYPGVAYIPDRFLVVVFSAFLAYWFDWESSGVAVLGKVEAASGHLFTFRWPFRPANMPYIRDAIGTSFLIALLGFFESSVAAKSIGGTPEFSAIQLSPNRELVALGAANLVTSCFMGLPAFGGYGRSKVNKSTGGKSPVASILLSLFTLITIMFLLPFLYYLPKPVLCSLISVVAWSLIEECPHDILFFLRIRAWQELGLMLAILLSTVFFSLTLGMAIGVGLSLLQVIRHSTRPRIQILGRIPGTNRFENAEAKPDNLEFIEGCLIVKIPEPLTFANTGELKTRLRRLELYGTSLAHPALPRLRREDSNRNIIFDIHGVTSLDGSGTQVLEEIVRDYRQRDVRIFFSRVPGRDSDVWKSLQLSGIVDLAGGEAHFAEDVNEALKMTEVVEDLKQTCIISPQTNKNKSSYFNHRNSKSLKMATPRSRILGALLGVHAGDSLGATLEFMSWEEIATEYRPGPGHRDITGGGPFSWPAGHATDDTDLTRAVLLAYRDIATGKGKPPKADVVELAARNMVDWYDGRWPGRVTGETPVDVGGATAKGIRRFKASGDVTKAGAGEGQAGNGSLMRCIPTGCFVSLGERERLVEESMAISRVTHDDVHCTISCAAYNGIVRALVEGKGVEEALQEGKEVVKVAVEKEGGGPKVQLVGKRVDMAINAGMEMVTIKELAEKGPKGARNGSKVLPFKAAGFVLESLVLGVAALVDTRSLEDVLVDVVMIGKDTDTNGAIAGGLLGARDGVEAVPLRWREKLQFAKEFEEVVDEILEKGAEPVTESIEA